MGHPAILSRRFFPQRVALRLEPEWASEAVRGALPRAPREEAAAYQREAEPLYGQPGEQRVARFAELDARWLGRLGLTALLQQAAEPFAPAFGVRPLCVLRPAPELEEGADVGRYDGVQAVRLAVKPARLLDAPAALAFCTHELGHVADMLDPAFGFDAERPMPGSVRAERELVRERFFVMWGASVDGRLAARGLPTLLSADGWRALARKVFPRADAAALGAAMGELLGGERPAHEALLGRCASAELGAPVGAGPAPGHPCPLCRFTTHAWAAPVELAQVESRIQEDFAQWSTDQGACSQCVACYSPG